MYVTVTDLKNYVYCPYIAYLKRVVGIQERTTEYMLYGKEIELEKVVLFLYSKFRVRQVIRNLQLMSRRLQLSGRVDIVIVDKYGRYIPVDLKWSEVEENVKLDHKVQLCAYALLLEENFNTVVKEGYILYNFQESGELRKVVITRSLRQYTLRVLEEVRNMIRTGTIPKEYRIDHTKCTSCEYRRQCIFKTQLSKASR